MEPAHRLWRVQDHPSGQRLTGQARKLQAAALIGVFDSGIGGLSVLKALRAELPGERFIYVADSGFAPYGERDAAHVQARARALTRYLVGRGVQALVVACNTATAAAIHLLRAEFPGLPIIGVEPALKPAVALSRTGRIGVMATRGTLESDKFKQLLASLQGQAHFVLRPCDGLALAIERSVHASPATDHELLACARTHLEALGPLGYQQIDTLVLGCTHYPLVAELLQGLTGANVHLVDTGAPVARQTRLKLAEVRGLAAPADGPQGQIELLSTGDAAALQAAARRWLQAGVTVQPLQLP